MQVINLPSGPSMSVRFSPLSPAQPQAHNSLPMSVGSQVCGGSVVASTMFDRADQFGTSSATFRAK